MKMHTAGSLLAVHEIAARPREGGVARAGTWLLNVVRSTAHGFVRWQRHRRNIQELQRMDDRQLADIGISRGEIEEGVRLGRWSKHTAELDKLCSVVE